jgi:hypothetical protein
VSEISLSEDGSRTLREAEKACWETNVAIVAPEHLLAGALTVLAEAGHQGLPTAEVLQRALMAAQGTGEQPLDSNVMFGSSARTALNFVALGVREAGGTMVDAAGIAAGTIRSGELNPMFFSALGWSKEALLEAIQATGGT